MKSENSGKKLNEAGKMAITLATAAGVLLFSLGSLTILTRRPASPSSVPTVIAILASTTPTSTPSPKEEETSNQNKPRTGSQTKEVAASSPSPTLYVYSEPALNISTSHSRQLATPLPVKTPPPVRSRETMTATRSHVVRRTDNLYRLAVQYQVSVESIMNMNYIADPDIIYVGSTLFFPAAVPVPLKESPMVSKFPHPEQSNLEEITIVGTIEISADDSEQITAPRAVATPTTVPEPLVQSTPTPDFVSQPTASVEPTPPPSQTPEPAAPTATAEIIPTPSSVESVYAVNGLPLESIAVLPSDVRQHIHEIYARGQSLGNNPRAFSKVGDSTSAPPHFLSSFDTGPYDLGPFAYLQPTINFFAGSIARQSVASRIGMHTWSVIDPAWANKTVCLPNETPIACEIRLHRPIIILIRLGSNDSGAPGLFDSSMRQAVQIALDNGVIPVLGTKPDRFEGASNINNIMIRQIAADYRIPLWELDLAAAAIPGRGLSSDNVHLTGFDQHDYTLSWALQQGHAVQNITALMTLYAILVELGIQP